MKPENMKYFDMIAHLGASSIHPDGFGATKKMLKAADFTGRRLLDIGCGTGYTACHLARLGFDVTGIDINDEMVFKADERAAKQGLRVVFKKADANNLPFDENEFDALIGESITAYLDKPRALSEYARVLRQNGRVALMEFTWLKEPSQELIEETKNLLDSDINIITSDEWTSLIEASGLKIIDSDTFPIVMDTKYVLKKIIDQGLSSISILYRTYSNPVFRAKMGDIRKHFNRNRDFFGYGFYIAEK